MEFNTTIPHHLQRRKLRRCSWRTFRSLSSNPYHEALPIQYIAGAAAYQTWFSLIFHEREKKKNTLWTDVLIEKADLGSDHAAEQSRPMAGIFPFLFHAGIERERHREVFVIVVRRLQPAPHETLLTSRRGCVRKPRHQGGDRRVLQVYARPL